MSTATSLLLHLIKCLLVLIWMTAFPAAALGWYVWTPYSIYMWLIGGIQFWELAICIAVTVFASIATYLYYEFQKADNNNLEREALSLGILLAFGAFIAIAYSNS